MMKNKKALLGSDFLLWMFRFLVIIVLIAAITFMVFAVQKRNYDIREAEASLISRSIMECITKGNTITPERVFTFGNCLELDPNAVYARLSVSNSTDLLAESSIGREEINVFCDIAAEKQKEPVVCLRNRYLVNFGKEAQPAYLNLSIALA